MLPAVAAAAGMMEAVKIPLRELGRRFTKSEIMIMSWRSSELSFNIRSKSPATNNHSRPDTDVDDRFLSRIEERIAPIVSKIENEKGEIDLRQLTGPEVMQYMGALGISMGRS